MAHPPRRICPCGNPLLPAESYCPQCKRAVSTIPAPATPRLRCPVSTCRGYLIGQPDHCPHCAAALLYDPSGRVRVNPSAQLAQPVRARDPLSMLQPPKAKSPGIALLHALVPVSSSTLLAVGMHWFWIYGLFALIVPIFIPPRPEDRGPFHVVVAGHTIPYNRPAAAFFGASTLFVVPIGYGALLLYQSGAYFLRVRTTYRCPRCQRRWRARLNDSANTAPLACGHCGLDFIEGCCWYCTCRAPDPACRLQDRHVSRKQISRREWVETRVTYPGPPRCRVCRARHRNYLLLSYLAPLLPAAALAGVESQWPLFGPGFFAPPSPGVPFELHLALVGLSAYVVGVLLALFLVPVYHALRGTSHYFARRFNWPGQVVATAVTPGGPRWHELPRPKPFVRMTALGPP